MYNAYENTPMTDNSYPPNRTAQHFVQPDYSFLSESGQFWPIAEVAATEVRLFNNLRTIIPASHQADIQSFIVPQYRRESGSEGGWGQPASY